jgi:hypothetical protein
MKREILLIAIIISSAITVQAQVSAGKYLLGGSFSAYDSKNAESSLHTHQQNGAASIQLGKAIKENTVIGIIASYSYYKNHLLDLPDSNVSKSNQVTLGLFYRKYKKLAKDLYFYAEGEAAYSHSTNSQEYFVNGNVLKNTSDAGILSFTPGISYAICKSFQVELLMPNLLRVSYEHDRTDYPNSIPAHATDKGNTFAVNANLNSNFLSNFGIGFTFLLGK